MVVQVSEPFKRAPASGSSVSGVRQSSGVARHRIQLPGVNPARRRSLAHLVLDRRVSASQPAR
jgi:hypothetical protein